MLLCKTDVTIETILTMATDETLTNDAIMDIYVIILSDVTMTTYLDLIKHPCVQSRMLVSSKVFKCSTVHTGVYMVT